MNGKRYTATGAPIMNLHGVRCGCLPERSEEKKEIKQRVKHYTLPTLCARYLCNGNASVCWECECGSVCEYGKMYMLRLRKQEEKAGRAWISYEAAVKNIVQPKRKPQQW